jgi:hypothetical protein
MKMSAKGVSTTAASGVYAANSLTQMAQTLRIGRAEFTEAELLHVKVLMEFVDRLVAEDPKAAAIMAAVKAKKRIL